MGKVTMYGAYAQTGQRPLVTRHMRRDTMEEDPNFKYSSSFWFRRSLDRQLSYL